MQLVMKALVVAAAIALALTEAQARPEQAAGPALAIAVSASVTSIDPRDYDLTPNLALARHTSSSLTDTGDRTREFSACHLNDR